MALAVIGFLKKKAARTGKMLMTRGAKRLPDGWDFTGKTLLCF